MTSKVRKRPALKAFFEQHPALHAVRRSLQGATPATVSFASLETRAARGDLTKELTRRLQEIAAEKPLVIKLDYIAMPTLSNGSDGVDIAIKQVMKAGRAAVRDQGSALSMLAIGASPGHDRPCLQAVIARLKLENATAGSERSVSTIADSILGFGDALTHQVIANPTAKDVIDLVDRFIGTSQRLQAHLTAKARRTIFLATDAVPFRLYGFMARCLVPLNKAVFATGDCVALLKHALTDPILTTRQVKKLPDSIDRDKLTHMFWRAARELDGFTPPLVTL